MHSQRTVEAFRASSIFRAMSEPPYPGDLLLHLASFRLLLAHARRGRQGAFEATARELGIDRSVLRRRIQTLREWLDVAILEGRGTDLRATAAGERLAERAERVLSLTGKLRADVAETRDTIAIACTGTISTELLPGVLAMLERRARPVQLIDAQGVPSARASCGRERSTSGSSARTSRHAPSRAGTSRTIASGSSCRKAIRSRHGHGPRLRKSRRYRWSSMAPRPARERG